MNRRELIKLIGLGMAFPRAYSTTFANENRDDQFLCLINIMGGWDTTLCLDPWTAKTRPDESDLFIEYRRDELLKFGNGFVGPTMKGLENYFNNMSIVNGIFLSETDNGHEAADRYMLTGSTKPQSSMSIRIADSGLISSDLGVIANRDVYKFNAKTSTSSIYGLSDAYSQKVSGSELETFVNESSSKTPLALAIRQLVSISPKMKQVFKYLDELGYESSGDHISESKIITSCFRANACQFAEIQIYPDGPTLDTHSGHTGVHKSSQVQVFGKIAEVLDLFKATPFGNNGESLFDKTTFMVTSEFSRTAALNSAKGKDHNPMTNSTMLIGKGIKGGEIVGASTLVRRKNSTFSLPYQIGLPYDFENKRVIKQRLNGSQFITPEVLFCTICEALNVDFRKVPGINPGTESLKAVLS